MFGKADDQRVAEVEVVSNRISTDIFAGFCQVEEDFLVSLGHLVVRSGFQFFNRFNAHLLHHRVDDVGTVDLAAESICAKAEDIQQARLDDALVEQAIRLGNLHQRPDFHTAARLAEQGNIFGVSAKGCNIVMNPFEGGDHVGTAGICGIFVFFAKRGDIHIAQDVQPVVDRDDNDIAILAHILAVVCLLFDRRTRREPAAMQPDHDRFFGGWVDRLGPDVQVLAVFIHRPVAMGDFHLAGTGFVLTHQRADIPVTQGVFDPFPALGRGGQLEAFGVGIFNAVEGIGAVQYKAAQFAVLGLDDRSSGRAEEFAGHIRYLLIDRNVW